MSRDLVKHVKQKALFTSDEPIVVALSGGVDSMVLFDVLYQLNQNLIIAHVNHQKRDESDKEFHYIKAFARSNCGLSTMSMRSWLSESIIS